MATQAQVDANRRNAAMSTGPNTDEGKARSRMNAVTHGLTAKGVPLSQQERINARYEAWKPTLLPENMFQEYHLMQAVEATVRVEQCQSAGRQRLTELSDIAADPGSDWANAREDEMANLAKSLKRDPQCVARQLRCSPAGRTWLIAEWTSLLIAVPENDKVQWTNAESNRALDLQGKSKSLRAILLDTQNPFAKAEITRAVILKEIAKLELEQVDADLKDDKLRDAHIQGFSLESDAKLKLLRRYETSAVRQYDKSIKILRSLQKVARERAKPVSTARPTTPADCEPNPILVPQESHIAEPQPSSHQTAPTENRYHRRKLQKQARRDAYIAAQTP